MIGGYFRAIRAQGEKLAMLAEQNAAQKQIEMAQQQEQFMQKQKLEALRHKQEMMAECERLGIDVDAFIND